MTPRQAIVDVLRRIVERLEPPPPAVEAVEQVVFPFACPACNGTAHALGSADRHTLARHLAWCDRPPFVRSPDGAHVFCLFHTLQIFPQGTPIEARQ